MKTSWYTPIYKQLIYTTKPSTKFKVSNTNHGKLSCVGINWLPWRSCCQLLGTSGLSASSVQLAGWTRWRVQDAVGFRIRVRIQLVAIKRWLGDWIRSICLGGSWVSFALISLGFCWMWWRHIRLWCGGWLAGQWWVNGFRSFSLGNGLFATLLVWVVFVRMWVLNWLVT